MKTKRLLAFVLPALFAVLLIAGFSTVGAKAANGYTDESLHCICGSRDGTHLPGCDGTEVPWTEWTSTSTLPTEGYYYLSADVTLTTDSSTISTTLTASLFLDLNGHTINSHASTIFLLSAKTLGLTLLDSAGNGKIVVTGSPSRAGLFFLANSGSKTLTIYGGTYDASASTFASDKGIIRTNGAGACTINIHGGTILCGTTTAGYGAGIILEATGTSVMNITGGTIRGGRSVTHGGNIYAKNAPTINISGGVIKGGTAAYNNADGQGGNIILMGGALNMTGGVIKGGTAAIGGNVSIASGAVFTMTGGEIFGGISTVAEGSGGVGGNIRNSGSTATISGTAKVYDGYFNANPLNISNYNGGTTTDNGLPYFTTHCICGSKTSTHLSSCDGTQLSWKPWFTETTLPSTTGYYYLADDVTVSASVGVADGLTALDLNGFTVNSAVRVFNLAQGVNAELVILDTAGTGKVVMTTLTGGGTFSAMGGNGSKTLTIYGGTFDCSAITASGGHGGFVRATVANSNYTSTININGGEIIGGTMSNNKYGGAIYMATAGCTLNVTGGEIRGGVNTTHGGNIFMNTGSVFNMSGGKISGGKTTVGQGANIKLTGATMTMTGGEICGGIASESFGGNISATDSATLTVSGGKIYDGRAGQRGGNIYVSTDGTTATISLPAEIYDGYASIEGQNIYVNAGTVTKDDDCFYFTKWDHADFGGSIRLNDSIAVLFYVQNIEEYPERYHVSYEFNGETDESACTSANSNAFVVADCTAAQMAEEVVITVEYGDEHVKDVIFTKTYSIKAYCDGQIANSEASAELKALCRAVLTYGAATQLYNNINTDNLPTNAAVDLSDRAANGITLADSDNVYNSTVTGNAIVDASANLVLMSKPEFLFKFTALSGVNASGLTINVTKGGAAVAAEDLEITTSGNVVKVQVKNLNPASLRDVYTVTVSDGANSREITYSAMTYIYRKQSTTDAALDTACRALQYYFVKAAAYVASQN